MGRLTRLLGHCLRESWDGLWRNRSLSILAVLSIGVSLYVLGLFLLLVFNLNLLVDSLGRDMQVQIFFTVDAGPGQIASHRHAPLVPGRDEVGVATEIRGEVPSAEEAQ